MGDAISIPTAPRLGSNFTIGISNLMVGAIGRLRTPAMNCANGSFGGKKETRCRLHSLTTQ